MQYDMMYKAVLDHGIHLFSNTTGIQQLKAYKYN